MNTDNKYTQMQESFYTSGTSNHQEHNGNKDYWDILLNNENKFSEGIALDFGCGKGRNVYNLIQEFDFKRVDGIDISNNNISCLYSINVISNNKLWQENQLYTSVDEIPINDNTTASEGVIDDLPF